MLNETPVEASLLHQSGRCLARQVEILKRDFNFSSFAEASRAGLPYLPRIWLDCESVECFSFATVRDKKYRTSKQNSRREQNSGSLSANRAEISEPNWISRMAAGSCKLKVESCLTRRQGKAKSVREGGRGRVAGEALEESCLVGLAALSISL